jgi:hypothetical protein
MGFRAISLTGWWLMPAWNDDISLSMDQTICKERRHPQVPAKADGKTMGHALWGLGSCGGD